VTAGDVVEQRRAFGDAVGLVELAQRVGVRGLIVVGLAGEEVGLGALVVLGERVRGSDGGGNEGRDQDRPQNPHRSIFSEAAGRVKIAP
jgi:hypothetical protein